MPHDFPLLVAAAALIDEAGRVLAQQRPAGKGHGGLWEFPGGKLEPGETPEAALARELAEELGVVVAPEDMTPLSFASEAAGEQHLLLLLYVIRRWRGEPQALEAAQMRWVGMDELEVLPMPPADRPLVEALGPLLAG